MGANNTRGKIDMQDRSSCCEWLCLGMGELICREWEGVECLGFDVDACVHDNDCVDIDIDTDSDRQRHRATDCDGSFDAGLTFQIVIPANAGIQRLSCGHDNATGFPRSRE
jgi:hypothetical protein